jgi:hypothetical protein
MRQRKNGSRDKNYDGICFDRKKTHDKALYPLNRRVLYLASWRCTDQEHKKSKPKLAVILVAQYKVIERFGCNEGFKRSQFAGYAQNVIDGVES